MIIKDSETIQLGAKKALYKRNKVINVYSYVEFRVRYTCVQTLDDDGSSSVFTVRGDRFDRLWAWWKEGKS